ncbi:MAG: phosphatase PAP2 family protein [Mariniblastus sp.]|nr:phosphatase PAP2 family protein [Mariniblastus sp.]
MPTETQPLTDLRSQFTWPRILLPAAALLVGALYIAPYDVNISQSISAGFLPGDIRRIIHLSEIFAHGFGVLMILISLWVVFPDKRKFVPRIAMLAGLSGLTAQCIKLFLVRQRPGDFVDRWELATSTWSGLIQDSSLNMTNKFQSFPSGHTATAVGLAIGLTYVFPRGKYLFAVLAVMASLQRIVSNAHWTSDVLSGAAVGLIVSGLLMQNFGLGRFCNRLEDKRPTPS